MPGRGSGDRDGALDIFARPLGARRSSGARRGASGPRLKRMHRLEVDSWVVDSKGQLDREVVRLYWLQRRLRSGLVLQVHTTLHIFPQGLGGRMVTQELPTTSSHNEPMFCRYDGVDSRGYGRVRVEAGASATDFSLFWNGSAFVPRQDDKAARSALPDYERHK